MKNSQICKDCQFKATTVLRGEYKIETVIVCDCFPLHRIIEDVNIAQEWCPMPSPETLNNSTSECNHGVKE